MPECKIFLDVTFLVRVGTTIFLLLHLYEWNGLIYLSDGSGSKFFDPGQVGSIFNGLGWVSHLWFGLGFGKFPLTTSNFSIFSLRVKKKSLRAGSKSTRVNLV